MSQPPPPPGNPPEFGKSDGAVPPPGPPQAPQTPPPPPGYGYPAQTPPPPGGGYGYPAPGLAPAGGNPYAQPVPPAQNPYAQAPTQAAFPQAQTPPQGPPPPGYPSGAQPPYAGQPPYGQVPPQGPYGYQTPGQYPGGPGGGRSGNKLTIIIAAVVAAVLVIGGGVYLATKGSGDKPGPKPTAQSSSGGPTTPAHSSEIQFAWDKPADKVAEKDNLKTVFGIWFTDKYVVKNEIDKVVAYDIKTGAPGWTLPAASRGDCAAAKDTYQNLAAIQYGASCDQIMVFDLTTGSMKWSAKLPGGTGGKTDFDYSQMAISGDTVGVDWLSGSIAYRISTQKVLWQGGNGDCEDDGYAGGSQFVVIVNCDYKTYKVQVVNPEDSGKAKWSWEAPVGTQVNAIVSTDPVVVVLGTENNNTTDVVTLAAGRMQSRVSLGTDKYDVSLGDGGAQDVHNVLVSKDTVYLTLRSQGDSKGQVLSGIVAFNLSDGKQKWIAKPADKQEIIGLDFVDGQVLALEPPDYDVQGQLVTIDPASGAMKKYASFADGSDDHMDLSGLENYPVWHDGHFYVVTHTVYEGNDDEKYLIDFS
jgi:hypothetical protein